MAASGLGIPFLSSHTQEAPAGIALEVDDRAKDVIINKEEDVISPAEDAIDGPLCFCDVLADYFVRVPDSGKPILDLIVQLWSQSVASHIFTLLFHKWSFEVQLDNPEVLLRYSSALVLGATNVFWIDIQTNTRRFQTLFHYLLEDVALVQTRLNKIPVQAQRDMYLLLSRFILFYNSADKVDSFLKHCPPFPNAFLIGGPADIFVTELTDQLQKLKVEPVLLHYLSEIKVLQGTISTIQMLYFDYSYLNHSCIDSDPVLPFFLSQIVNFMLQL